MKPLFRLLWLELRTMQSVILIKWLPYRSCVIRALLCCNGRVGIRPDPFDWWVWRVVLSPQLSHHPFVSTLHHFPQASITITCSKVVWEQILKPHFTTLEALYCKHHPVRSNECKLDFRGRGFYLQDQKRYTETVWQDCVQFWLK